MRAPAKVTSMRRCRSRAAARSAARGVVGHFRIAIVAPGDDPGLGPGPADTESFDPRREVGVLENDCQGFEK